MSRRRRDYSLTEEQRELAAENIMLVPWAINKQFGHAMTRDEDIISEGYIGLCIAANTYRAEMGCAFSTYAYKVIINIVRRKMYLESMPKRTPEVADTSMEAPVKSTEGAKRIKDLLEIPNSNPEYIYCENERRREIASIAARIKEEAFELTVSSRGIQQKDLAAQRGVTQQAISSLARKQKRRITVKYGEEYRRIMGYETDDSRRA